MNLEVKDLCYSYGKHEVVRNVSFRAEPGQLLSVLGMNGAGKSTMLRCIGGICAGGSGEVCVDGAPVRSMRLNDLAKCIGMVPQNCEFTNGTVFDSVLLGRKPFIRWDVTEDDLGIVQTTLHLLGLEEFASRNVLELSGGERQKVAIARVLAQQTPVILFDEPTSNLDLRNQLDVLDTIRRIVREKKLTAVVTIHDLNLALRFSDRFLAMRDGEVYRYGDGEIVTEQMIRDVYGVNASVIVSGGHKVVVPD